MTSYLPQHEGFLQYWLLLLSVVSIGNSVQSYLATSYTRRVYSAPETTVTPLHSRAFGTYTALASIIRLYAAYNITDPMLYHLALWTYVVALGHFYSEWLIFGTARWGKGLAGPVIISVGSLAWMVSQWRMYVR
ncbi:MAG: hypothetical protein LQ349_003256 [Xanthoria aureola]|nr:MAG: hypothetical protein LQ349_003256 [Xanthoria aureola]